MSEPVCEHRDDYIGRVSSHRREPASGEPHASTYVCHRRDCVTRASRWVAEHTGLVGVFWPFTPAHDERERRRRERLRRNRTGR